MDDCLCTLRAPLHPCLEVSSSCWYGAWNQAVLAYTIHQALAWLGEESWNIGVLGDGDIDNAAKH